MLRLFSVCILIFAAPVFAQAPSCADGRTVLLVKEIFTQSIERQAAGFPQGQRLAKEIMALISVDVHSIRTVKVHRPVGRNHCQGVLEIGLSQQGAARMNNPRALAMMAQDPEMQGIRFSGRSVTNGINFSSQLTDDGRDHVVETSGHQVLAELVFQLVGQEAAERLTGRQTTQEEASTPTAQWDHNANVQNAVKAFVAAYRDIGIAGTVGMVEECYKAVSRQNGRDAQLKRLEYCAGMDLAASRLDSELAKRNRLSSNGFFSIDNVTARIDRHGTAYFPESEFRAGIVERWTKMASEALSKHGAR